MTFSGVAIRDPFGAVASFSVIVSALYGTVLPFGAWGYLGGAVGGLLWVWLLGRLTRHWRAGVTRDGLGPDAPVFTAVVATGLLLGGGVMYVLLFRSVLDEPTTTYAVLSALMRPTVPFFIVVNSLMELLIVPTALYLNWTAMPRRKGLVLAAALVYLVTRVWTYLVYAERRLVVSTQPLTAADVGWYVATLATDYRLALVAVTHALFSLAAFVRPGGRDRVTAASGPAAAES
jgi:hypothetical protein